MNKFLFYSIASALSVLFSGNTMAQFDKDYQALEYSRSVPNEYTDNYPQKIQEGIRNETTLSKANAKDFYKDLYKGKYDFFMNGDVYFSNKLETYVYSIVSKLMQNNPSALNNIKIYITRSASANAFALPDGSVFVNVGLIARMENEAQLAFILAHEIAHVQSNHAKKAITKMEEISSQQRNYENFEADLYRKLQYSRDDEFDADSKGVQYVMASGYDAQECHKALEAIGNDNYFKIDSLEKKLKSLCSDYVTIDTNWFKGKQECSEDGDELVFSTGSDDLYSTHPDISKRISAVQEILGLMKYSNTTKVKNLVENDFSTIKNMALLECIENMYKNSQFNTSLYLSLFALDTFPNNSYLKTSLVKNLYWLSFYKEINCVKNIIDHSGQPCKDEFPMYNHFISEIPHNDLKKILFGYMKQHLDECEDKDEYYFYYGLGSELYLGKDPAKLIFNQYLMKFPSGKFVSAAKAKTE